MELDTPLKRLLSVTELAELSRTRIAIEKRVNQLSVGDLDQLHKYLNLPDAKPEQMRCVDVLQELINRILKGL